MRMQKSQYSCHVFILTSENILQIIGEGMGDAYLKLKLGDQKRAFETIESSPSLKKLRVIKSPLVDLEVRGVPALQYFGGIVWGDMLEQYMQREYFLNLRALYGKHIFEEIGSDNLRILMKFNLKEHSTLSQKSPLLLKFSHSLEVSRFLAFQ